MQRTRIKICGIKDVDTALAAVDAGADAIGLVFVEKSPRNVSVEIAAEIVAALPVFVEPVGLFVDRPASEINRIVQDVGIKTIQLHGYEPISILDELDDVSVVRAKSFDLDYIEELRPWDAHSKVKALLFDAPPDEESGLTGGSGITFAWAQICHMPPPPFNKEIILAGGLTPDNVYDALKCTSVFAVDVSSGVESERGVKSRKKIEKFCEAVRLHDIADK